MIRVLGKKNFTVVCGFIMLLCFESCVSDIYNNIRIRNFRNHDLSGEKIYQSDTLATPKYIIVRQKFERCKVITTNYLKQGLTKTEYFYNYDWAIATDQILKTVEIYDTTHRPRGVWQCINTAHVPYWTLDYDNKTYEIYDSDDYTNLEYLINIRHKADSILIATYGEQFVRDNIQFEQYNSRYITNCCRFNYVSGDSISDTKYHEWLEASVEGKPSKYILDYGVALSNKEYCEKIIELHFDSLWNVLLDYSYYEDERVRGLQKPVNNVAIKINRDSAMKILDTLGLRGVAVSSPYVGLRWHFDSLKKNDLYNGYYTYDVIVPYKYDSSMHSDNVKYYYTYYYVCHYDPWAGSFLGKEKMYSYYIKERSAGFRSGLIHMK